MKKILCALIIISLVFPTAFFALASESSENPATSAKVFQGADIDFDELAEMTGSATDTSIAAAVTENGGLTGISTYTWMSVGAVNSNGAGKRFLDITKNTTDDNATSALVFRFNEANTGSELRCFVEKCWYRPAGQTVGAIQTLEFDVTPLVGTSFTFNCLPRTTPSKNISTYINFFDSGRYAYSDGQLAVGETYHIILTINTAKHKFNVSINGEPYGDMNYTTDPTSTNVNAISFIDFYIKYTGNDISQDNQAKIAIDNYKSYYTYPAPEIKSFVFSDKAGNVTESNKAFYDGKSVTVCLDKPISNTNGNISLLKDDEAVAAGFVVSSDGLSVSAFPTEHLVPNTDYEICIGKDVTFETKHSSGEWTTSIEKLSIGYPLHASFKTASENMIAFPKDGDHVPAKDGKITFSAYVKEDVESVDFYVDSASMGTAVPDVNLVATLEASADELIIGKKELKAVVHGTQDTELKINFWFSNPQRANEIVGLLGGDIAKSEFISLITSNEVLLEIDNEDEFYKNNKEEILTLLYNGSDTFNDVGHFNSELDRAYALIVLSKSEAERVPDVLEIHAEDLGIDYENDYVKEDRLSNDEKQLLCSYLCSKDFTKDFSDFKSAYSELAVLSVFVKAENWLEIENILTSDFANEFKSMLSGNADYNKLPSKQKVYQYMIAYDYEKYEDIEANFAKASEKAYGEYSNQITPGSDYSMAGAGKHGSSSVMIDPAIISQGNSQSAVASDIPVTLNANAVSSFGDVSQSHWSYKSVSALFDAGIIKGYDGNVFMPDNSITRAEFAKLLALSFQFNSGEAQFSDIGDNDWYAPYIRASASRGIILGADGNFMPNQNITRQDAAVMIYRTFTYLGKVLNGRADYDDTMEIALYALPAVGALKENSVMVGSGTSFNPTSSITRAEAAQLLYNSINTISGMLKEGNQ